MATNFEEIGTAPIGNPGYAPLLFGGAAIAVIALALAVPRVVTIFGAVAIFTLSFRESEPFLLLLIFLLPVDVISIGGSVVNDLGEAVRMLVVIGFFLGRLCRGELDLRVLWRPAITRSSLLFFAAVVLSAILGSSGETRATIRGAYFIATYIGFYLMAFVWVNTRKRLEKLLFTLMWSTFAVCGFGLFQYIAGEYTSFYFKLYPPDIVDPWGRRPASVLGQPNHLAGYLNIVLAFALSCYLLTDDRRWKRISACFLVLGTLVLALTQSRGGYIAFMLMVLVALWKSVKNLRKRWSLTAAFLGLAVLTAIAVAKLGPDRLQTEGSGSIMIRFILWDVAWQLFQSSPVHGVGFGTFQLINEQYLPRLPDLPTDLGAHNIYLELLAETGILGLGAFLTLMYTVLREGGRQLGSGDWLNRALALTVVTGGLGLMIEGFTDHYLFWSVQIGTLFWLLMGLLLASKRESVL